MIRRMMVGNLVRGECLKLGGFPGTPGMSS